MDEITAAGLDIDQGMVLKFKQVTYYGPEAIHMLSLLSTRAGWFNRLCFMIFATRCGARVFYPLGKAFRNLLLKVLGIALHREPESAGGPVVCVVHLRDAWMPCRTRVVGTRQP
jgi:hypothetical protein